MRLNDIARCLPSVMSLSLVRRHCAGRYVVAAGARCRGEIESSWFADAQGARFRLVESPG